MVVAFNIFRRLVLYRAFCFSIYSHARKYVLYYIINMNFILSVFMYYPPMPVSYSIVLVFNFEISI